MKYCLCLQLHYISISGGSLALKSLKTPGPVQMKLLTETIKAKEMY